MRWTRRRNEYIRIARSVQTRTAGDYYFKAKPLEIQVKFKGTPAQFASVAWTLSKRLRVSHRHLPYRVRHASEVNPQAPFVSFEIASNFQTQGETVYGEVTAQIVPNGESKVVVFASDYIWPKLEPWWELLRRELEQQGWIEPTEQRTLENTMQVNEVEKAKTERQHAARLDLDVLSGGSTSAPHRASWLESREAYPMHKEWTQSTSSNSDDPNDLLELKIRSIYQAALQYGWEMRCFHSPDRVVARIFATTRKEHCHLHDECAQVEITLDTSLQSDILRGAVGRCICQEGKIALRDFTRALKTVLPGVQSAERVTLLATEGRGEQTKMNLTTIVQQVDKLPPADSMREYYSNYSEKTAKEILDGMLAADKVFRASKRGRWGPGLIKKHTTITRSETVGRYLSALYRAGIKEWKGVKIPYHPKHQSSIQSIKKK